MRNLVKLATLCLLSGLSACAAMLPAPPAIGEPGAAVRARLGAPTAVYPAPAGQLWEYATGPYGQFTWMAAIGPDGRLARYEQVLTGEKFATIKVDQDRKDDVLQTVGRPAEQSRVMMHNYEVWSYRYKEAGVWNSMMHVHFDEAGIVRLMQNGADPMYEEKRRFFD